MLICIWFTLILTLHELIAFSAGEQSPDESNKVEVKIGFLVGSKRPNQRYVFHHALGRINQLYSRSSSNSSGPSISFVPVIAETEGDGSVSIKQTIALLTGQAVNFIVGPQETCQVESQLASIFNVAMISHYCSQWSPFNYKPDSYQASSPSMVGGDSMTFIQTKPPHWKIVERVVTLVSQLLEAHDQYPQNLVLLYFKQPAIAMAKSDTDKRLHLFHSTVTDGYDGTRPKSLHRKPQLQQQLDHQTASDAIQYKLIGELLEIKLNELLVAWRQSAGGRNGAQLGSPPTRRKQVLQRPLAVLNWHTTFHYGFTKNPFRQLIRRHLFQQQSVASGFGQCNSVPSSASRFPTKTSTTSAPAAALNRDLSPSDRAAIYIVVGHYYEHLGLMLALNELGLLSGDFAEGERGQRSASSLNQRSVVVGVDTEEYDERDDSVRFLRGLLMDESNENNRQQFQSATSSHTASGASDQLGANSIVAMYGYYLGVVPAKPTRMVELLEEIRQSSRSQTYSVSAARQLSVSNVSLAERSLAETTGNDSVTGQAAEPRPQVNQSALGPSQLTTLFRFMRLQVEAFYLYDSIVLLGAYFSECLQRDRLPLAQCSNGRRARKWFENREYRSFVNQNLTSFDSEAQTEGLYTLITRRTPFVSDSNAQADVSETGNEDEVGLIPVGQFVRRVNESSGSVEHEVEFFASNDSINPVWLPLWCIVRKSNSSACMELLQERFGIDSEEAADGSQLTLVLLLCLTVVILCFALSIGYFSINGNAELPFTNINQVNAGWFDEQDEKNFLNIVNSHLLASELLLKSEDIESDGQGEETCENRIMVELHCHMFPFPSCRFVHWLTALHQLREMMFQYLPSIERNPGWTKSHSKNQQSNGNFREFFTRKHKGTASLRLLLNKYKSINECFCYLSDLNHKSIVKLYGTTLLFNEVGKSVRLVVEQPDRGSIRDAIELLKGVLSEDKNNYEDDQVELTEFMSLLTISLVNDLLDGLNYLHESKTGFHGELRATTCLVTSDWRLKLSGFHTAHMRRSLGDYERKNLNSDEESELVYLNELVYSAPEVLEHHNRRRLLDGDAMKLADIYSFAFVFYELLVGEEPWSCLTQVTSSKLLISRVKVESSFRPPLSRLDKRSRELEQVTAASSPTYPTLPSSLTAPPFAHTLETACLPSTKKVHRLDLSGAERIIRSCWSHLANRRPQSVATLRNRLLDCCLSSKSPASFNPEYIHGQTVKCYAKLLELVAVYRKQNLALERKRSKEFQLKLLPENVVAKLRNPNNSRELFSCRRFECVSFCSFRVLMALDGDNSQHQEHLSLLEQLNELLDQLDRLVSSYQKRIHLLDSQVDSSMRFMVYAGEPLLAKEPTTKDDREILSPSQLIASFALQLIDLSNRWQLKFGETANMRVRCGLHCGPVMGGLLHGGASTINGPEASTKLARYILFGSSMQWVDALESSSLPQRIQISTDFRQQLIHSHSRGSLQGSLDGESRQSYVMIKREGKVYAKNLGEFESHWLLNGPRLTASQSLMLLNTS